MPQTERSFSINPLHQSVRAWDGGVYILGESNQRHSTSSLLADVLEQLQTTQSESDLLETLAKHPPEHVFYALNILEQNNIILKGSAKTELSNTIEETLIRYDGFDLVADNKIALDALEPALTAVGFHPIPDQVQHVAQSLRVVLSGDFLSPSSQSRLYFSQNSQIRTVPVKLMGERSYFGPILGGSGELCADCVWERMRANRPIENHLNQKTGRAFGFNDLARVGLSPFADQVAMEVAKAIAQNTLPSGIVEFNREGKQFHTASGLVSCINCLAKTGQPAHRFDWGKRMDTTLRQGGYRSSTAKDVTTKLKPLVSDLIGLVSAMGPLTFEGPARDRHVWAATYPITPKSDGPTEEDFHSTAMGKGMSAEQAQASAICESVERISAQFLPHHQIRKASAEELGADVINPNSVWNFSDDQFQNRDAWNAQTDDIRRHIPAPFDPLKERSWTPVWSLTEERQKWMLREQCYINAPHPHYGRFDPNGCAAGMTLEEAALQAMLELVERDCIAIWWYNQLHRPGIDPSKSSDPNLKTLAQGFQAQGWDSWLLDLRNDLDIPCFAALARAQSDGRWCIGFGAHFEWQLAAERAMSELAQMFRENGRDGPPPWEDMDQLQSQYLYPHAVAEPYDAPITGAERLSDLIDWLIQNLIKKDIELLILDQTRPDVGFPVVKTFAPGLRHFWPRLGEGRLFDVPVKMRWLQSPKLETELNPVHLFL